MDILKASAKDGPTFSGCAFLFFVFVPNTYPRLLFNNCFDGLFRCDGVFYALPLEPKFTPISFGDHAKNGFAPLGIECVVNSCFFNNASMWCTSRAISAHGLLCPRAKLKTATIEARIESLAHAYPVVNKIRAMGVATHERENLRGFHLIGDDDGIASLWTGLYTYDENIPHWDVPMKAMCWTAMVPGSVYVPYLDIDERGMEHDFHRVWTQRVAPTISCITSALSVLSGDAVTLGRPLIFFNTREVGGLWKFSFHVHWPTLGVENIGEWKNFISSIVDMPRRLIWTARGGEWEVTEDPKNYIFDPAVYGGRRQLFRGPFCGKEGHGGAVLLPCAMQVGQNGQYEFIPKKYDAAQIKAYILQARIARYAEGLTMLKFQSNMTISRAVNLDDDAPPAPILPAFATQNHGTMAALFDFVMPFFRLFILPRWQHKRKGDVMRLNTQGAVVPVKNVKIMHDTPHRTRPGCRFMAVEGDSFCAFDAAHVHTRSVAPIGLCIDFVKCTIQQTCHACGISVASEKFCFLHTNNRIDICTEADSSFTGLSHWVPTKGPYQMLLDYFSDLFILQRANRALWVYDRDACVWRTDIGGNMVVGKLIDELNEKHVRYLHCYKKIVIERQNNSFARMNENASQEEVEAFSVKIHSEARKFMSDNTPFISLGAAARGKVIDDLRSYSIHNEIKEMNCFPQYIPMKNKKYIDVFTGEMGDMAAHHYFTSCVNAEIIPPCDDTKRIESWFFEIATGDQDKATYLKRFAAYCFTFLVHDRMFVVLKGTGKNAKGAWKEFVMKISKGPEGMDSRGKNLLQNYWDRRGNANTSPENATPESYELLNKTFLYTDDMMPVPLDTNKIKRMVAGEDGSGRGLYGKPVDLHVLGKIVWTSNFDTDGPGEDNAFWERQVLLPMLTKYVGPGEVVDAQRYRFAQNHVAYMELLELRDAFFTIAVEALVKYYKTLPWNAAKNAPSQLASFPLPASVIKYNQEARARQLPLAGFMKEYTRPEIYPMNFCRAEDAFESYMIYLENVNETKAKKETTLTSFGKLLAIALDINVEGGYVQGRALHKKIISIKKKQFEDRSYGPFPPSLSSAPFPPVNEFLYLDAAMSNAPV